MHRILLLTALSTDVEDNNIIRRITTKGKLYYALHIEKNNSFIHLGDDGVCVFIEDIEYLKDYYNIIQITYPQQLSRKIRNNIEYLITMSHWFEEL